MNIVKFKDIIITPEESGLTQEQCDLFNEKFRGKYVHCIDWSYVIPIEEMTEADAVETSKQLLEAQSVEDVLSIWSHMAYNILLDYTDIDTTTKINSIKKYLEFNSFVPEDITLDQIKKFRTWLATTLLSFDIQDSKILHMLNYYAGGMYDETVETLTEFGTPTDNSVLNNINTSSCGCSSGVSQVVLNNISLCDPLAVYRKNIYLFMIEVFSKIDFWMGFDQDFLKMFKLYIDGIVQYNLPLHNDIYSTNFVDCTCQIKGNTEQDLNIQRLIRLSKSLQYMIDDEIAGNKNFITISLTEWATYLYERMEW